MNILTKIHLLLFCGLMACSKPVASQSQPMTIPVASVSELYKAVDAAQPGQTILMADGVYNDVQLRVRASGTPERLLRLMARNPGRVVFSGDARLEIWGRYMVFGGVVFQNGKRDPQQWQPHGPGLVALYGSHNRITDCAFDGFDEAHSAWITTSLTPDGQVPQYCRIDHCSFTNKLTFDQVINLNATPRAQQDSLRGGPPMYHRIDHNFFSNPRKPGNAGGAIRVGYYRFDGGRCQIDSNLFMHQDSEPEIITSKSRENVYYANTFLNCRGTLNFRHGDQQVALNNFFIGTNTDFEYGGMFVWGSRHVIGCNYFNLPATLRDRGSAALYLNPGAVGTEHALAYDMLVANNAFINNAGHAIHFNPLDEQRKKQAGQNGWTFDTPHHIQLLNNFFYATGPCAFPFFRYDYPGNHDLTWQGNLAVGCTAGLAVASGLAEAPSCPLGQSQGRYEPTSCPAFTYNRQQQVADIPGIALPLAELLRRGISGRPLTPREVGPSWPWEPPAFAQTGVLPPTLQADFKRIINSSPKRP